VEEQEGTNDLNEEIFRARVEHVHRVYNQLSSEYEETVDNAKNMLKEYEADKKLIDRWIGGS
jgi:hypothetical protein